MLLGNRRKLNQQTGEMEGGGNTLTFDGGLPDVQINDPRLPMAELFAKLPGMVAKGMGAMKGMGSPAAGGGDPYGLGSGDLNVGRAAQSDTPKVSGGAPVGTDNPSTAPSSYDDLLKPRRLGFRS